MSKPGRYNPDEWGHPEDSDHGKDKRDRRQKRDQKRSYDFEEEPAPTFEPRKRTPGPGFR